VTVLQCKGKIVVGGASEFLFAEINRMMELDRRSLLLHLGEVGFLDSSGLGAMVRGYNTLRHARGELKLCEVPPHLLKVLKVTSLDKVFDVHPTEEGALEAFYRNAGSDGSKGSAGKNILCFGSDANVLAYLREVLHRSGYEVQTASLVGDARLLLRVMPIDLMLVGAEKAEVMQSSALKEICAKVPCLQLDTDFAGRSPDEAGSELLQLVREKLGN
jgi:anti-sigma B factor antagonist